MTHLGRVGVGVFKFRTGERKEGVDKVKREQFSLQYAINLFTSVHTDRQTDRRTKIAHAVLSVVEVI